MMRWISVFAVCLAIFGTPEPVQAQQTESIGDGARLWNMTCTRCHNLRPPEERTDQQWDVIVSHMRTRANLTKSEVRAVAAFLKEVNADPEDEGASGEAASDSTGPGTTKNGAD